MKKRILSFLLSLTLILNLFISVNAASLNKIKVHFIDVGQADCILIQAGSYNMLIDAGNNDDEKTILGYLNKQGVKKIDYVIGTHPHEDHIGAMDAVIKNYEIGKIYMPKVTANTKTFEDVLMSIKAKNLKISIPTPGTEFKLGEATCSILAPNSNKYEDLNNYSIVIKLKYGNTSFLFTGDAEDVSEKEMISKKYDLKADVLKVGHHGSKFSTTKEFLDVVIPKYAVISVGKGNDYGHPAKETVDRLTSKGITVYRTDEKGTIVCESDGKNITFPGIKQAAPKIVPVKVAASVNNANPAKNSTVMLSVTGPGTAKVTVVCKYKSTKTTYTGTIGSTNKATIPIKIGRAASKFKVIIDVTVSYQGKNYKAQTYFTPR